MNTKTLKLNIIILTALIVFNCGCAFASYEVYSAKTIENNNIKEKTERTIPTANDPDLPNFSEDQTVASYIKNKSKKLFKKKKTDIIMQDSNEENNTEPVTEEKIQIKDKDKFQINADKITYDDSDGNVYAKGHVEIIAKAQNLSLKADNAVLDKTSQTIKLQNNVKIIKDGIEMQGESLIVDLNEENIIMDNPTAQAYSFTINAQESYLIANNLQMLNGTITSTTKRQFPVVPPRFIKYAPDSYEELYDPEIRSDLNTDCKKQTYRIDAKEIVVTNYKDHNSLLLKGSNIYYNNHKIAPRSDIEIIADKENQVIEVNTPEIGTLRSFGTYLGYGFLYRLPKGQTLKIMPAIVQGEGNLGLGLMGRHRTRNNLLEAGYSTSTNKLVARGVYNFGNGFKLRYGKNAYIPEGFMGARRSAYALQLGYEKTYHEKEQNISFRHGAFAGIFSDYEKHGKPHHFATTRFRYNMELAKYFLEYKNREQDLDLKLGLSAQSSATLYGTGDTAALFRIGPMLRAKVRRWESLMAYHMGGIHGDSPFVFDKYRYGRCSITVNQRYNFNNKFALGYSTVVSPNKDNYERDLITESRLYALFGPQDLKFALSYDFVRSVAHLDLMFILGSDSTKINFEKLTTKNLDSSKQKQDFYKKAKTVKVEDI